MKLEDFEKIKKELEKQRREIYQKINLFDERKRMADVNKFEYKALITLFFTVITYFPLVILSLALIKFLGLSIITNIMPAKLFPILLISFSVSMGNLARYKLHKKNQVKERFRAFSNAKTEMDKLEQKTYYQIELEKVQNRYRTIDNAITMIESNKEMVSKLSNKYSIKDKNSFRNQEELKINIDELSANINKQYEKLDVLSTKKVLHQEFWSVRWKVQRILNTFVFSFAYGVIGAYLCGFATKLVSDAIIYSSSFTSTLDSFMPLIVCLIGGPIYMTKRNKEHMKVFNKFNSQLGEDALSELIDYNYEDAYSEKLEIDKALKKQLDEISLVVAELEEQKCSYSNSLTENNDKLVLLQNNNEREFLIQENYDRELPVEEMDHPLTRVRRPEKK